MAGVGRCAADRELVEQRHASGRDLAHRGLDHIDVQERQCLADPAAEELVGGEAVDPLQRGVDQDVAQLGVQHGQPDRGLCHQPHRQCEVALHAAHGRLVAGESQRVDAALLVEQPHIAELHQPTGAVLVPHGEDPGPGAVARHDLREEPEDQVDVLVRDQQPGRGPAQRLLRAPPEQFLGLRAPQHDPSVGAQHHRGHAQHIQQTARLRRRDLDHAGLTSQRIGHAHAPALLRPARRRPPEGGTTPSPRAHRPAFVLPPSSPAAAQPPPADVSGETSRLVRGRLCACAEPTRTVRRRGRPGDRVD